MTELEIRKDEDEYLIIPATTPFEDWWAYRHKIEDMRLWQKKLHTRETFHAIDWIMQGEQHYGHEASQALAFVEQTLGWTESTYETYRSVAQRYPPGQRRKGLTMGHYRQIMDLEPREASELLDKAAAEGMNTRDLHAAAMESTGRKVKPKPVSKQEFKDTSLSLLQTMKPDADGYKVDPYWALALAELVGYDLPELVIDVPGSRGQETGGA